MIVVLRWCIILFCLGLACALIAASTDSELALQLSFLLTAMSLGLPVIVAGVTKQKD